MALIDGNRLKRARKSKGYTQKELACAAGIAQATVSMAETGASNVSMMKLATLAQLLDVDVRELIVSTYRNISKEEIPHLPDEIREAVRVLNKYLMVDVAENGETEQRGPKTCRA